MSERIRELLSQAGVHYEVMPKDTVYEKFAESIIKECADLFKLVHTDEQYQRRIDKTLYKHFGLDR
jgi:NAD-dependent DNA ligase